MKYASEFKERVVRSVMERMRTVSELSKIHRIDPRTIKRWIKDSAETNQTILSSKEWEISITLRKF